MYIRRDSCVLFLALLFTLGTTGCGGGPVASVPVNPQNPPPPPPPAQLTAIAIKPGDVSLLVGAKQQLSIDGTYSDGSHKDVTSAATWTDSNQAVAGIDGTGMVRALFAGTTTITAKDGDLSATATITVNGANVPTWHGDNQRTGLNGNEAILTTANVNPQSFGKLFSYFVDGYIYGQPLYVSNLTIKGGAHNVVFVATENDSVYAFDADTPGDGSPLWKVSLLGAGESAVLNPGGIRPFLGVTSTPAIDLVSNTMYVFSIQNSVTSGNFFRLHALDITTGAEKLGGPVIVTASVPGTSSKAVNGIITLSNGCLQRAALLVANGVVVIAFGYCGNGWLLSYDAQTLTQVGVFNTSPNLDGLNTSFPGAGGIWMGGGGPAVDSNGNIYVTTGDGPYEGITAFGDSALKFDAQLHLLDHFAPYDALFLGCKDADVASGGIMLIPGTTQALFGGKSGKLFMVNTTAMGGSKANDAGATQTLWFEEDLSPHYSISCTDTHNNNYTSNVTAYEIFSTAAFFNGSIYLGITPTGNAPSPVRQFTYANGVLTPSLYTSTNFPAGSMGATPFISANGNSNGIVWVIDHGAPIRNTGPATNAVLHAYDASNLGTELYNSGQNPADAGGLGIKFSSPIVANGKVFFATGRDQLSTPNPAGELDVYGLKN